MSFPTYPDYTASGVEWLGDVPDHWDVVPLKRLLDIQNGADYKHVEQDDGYPVIGSGGPFTWASEYLFDGESVLLGRKGTVDKPLYVTGRFWTVDTMYWSKIRPGINGRFAYYTATTMPFAYYTTSTALPSMTQTALNNHRVALPPHAEQIAIATFLDNETAKIDALVEEQRCLIALLKEKRQAVISHAVTKGLNPDAPMKDSGVEWLGEVPAHWEMRRFKEVCSEIIDCKNRTPEPAEDGNFLVVRTSCIRDGKFDSLGGYLTDYLSFQEWTRKGVPGRGDVLFTREAPAGEACMAPENIDFCLGQRMMYLRPRQQIMVGEFLLFNVYGPLVRARIEGLARGSTVSHLRVGEVGELQCFCPPMDEQNTIISRVRQISEEIDELSDHALEAIELLKERRAALVSAAVIGKIDVRSSADILALPVDRARARGLIATEIIERSAHQTTFGRVKLQKIAYLAEAHAGVTELEGDYLREAAGPLDREMIREMEREAGMLAGVRVEQPDGAGSAVIYRLGDRRGAHQQDLAALLGDRAAKFYKLVADIDTIETKGAEAVATLYAVWNDALIDGETPADMELKLAVLSEWHPEKAEKFTINELQIWLDWMRRHGLVPTGAGPKTTTGRLFA